MTNDNNVNTAPPLLYDAGLNPFQPNPRIGLEQGEKNRAPNIPFDVFEQYVGGDRVPKDNSQSISTSGIAPKPRHFSLAPGQCTIIYQINPDRRYFFVRADYTNAANVSVLYYESSFLGGYNALPDRQDLTPGDWYEPWLVPYTAISVHNYDQSNTVTGYMMEG